MRSAECGIWRRAEFGIGSRRTGPRESRTNDVEQVAVGPVVGFDQGPEGDDQGVDVGILPLGIGIVGHGFAEGGPFG